MPEMDGYEATQSFRIIEKEKEKNISARTPIIAITADAVTGNEQRCYDAGMDDYLNKPIKDQQIEYMLEKWLSRDRSFLIVDDSDNIRMVLHMHLKRLGYKADTVSSGRKAIDKLKQKHYDIVFMDYHMPEINGPETVALIRADKEINSNIKIIALSGNTDKKIKDECLNSGMNDYIVKPFGKQEIMSIVEKWLF